MTSDLMRGHPLHARSGGARPGVELVDEETGEAIVGDELERTLKVLSRFRGEATDYVRGNSQVRYTARGEWERKEGGRKEGEGGREREGDEKRGSGETT